MEAASTNEREWYTLTERLDLPVEIAQWLDREAEKTDRSLSDVIVHLVRYYRGDTDDR